MLLAAPAAAEAFELKDGDRVVFLGATLIEREQRYGYWETALTGRWPDRNVTFRNLGWSGDTVWGDARAGFGTRADGFKALKEHVLALKPTVLIIAYGGNEAFDGEAGLPKFVDGMNALLDALGPAQARVVLLAPLQEEDLGRPLPDPGPHNKELRRYADAIQEIARKRDCTFADLNPHLDDGPKAAPLTDDGLHLTAAGYWRTALALERALGLPERRWEVEVHAAGRKPPSARGTRVDKVETDPVRFQAEDVRLPGAPAPADGARPMPAAERTLRVAGLREGKYTLFIDGKPTLTDAADRWAKGVIEPEAAGPELDQADKLRQAIVAKNRLYFYRWRPANETYLFGFRKGEQGQNAVEIPKFDPLVEEKEKEIAKLRMPAPHTYELKPEAK